MQIVLSLFGTDLYLTLPNHLVGWLGLLAMAALLGWGVWKIGREEGKRAFTRRPLLFIGLLIAALPLAGLLGVRLPGETLPQPSMPMEVSSPVLMLLAALPWVMASGLCGAVPAVLLALLDGLILALFETHSPFTMLELGLLALVYSMLVRQNYRTLFYRLLRHPFAAGWAAMLLFTPVLIVSSIVATNGSLAARLDYAFTQTWLMILARSGEVLLAALFAEMVFLFMPHWWGSSKPLQPSPSESSLQARFLVVTAPLVIILVVTLVISDWLVAGNAARSMLEQRLSSTAQVAADSLPYFLESGENLILTLATPDLASAPQPGVMEQKLRSVPFFRQLFLFDSSGTQIASYPQRDFAQVNPSQEEIAGLQLALKGINVQHYILPAQNGDLSAQIAFVGAVHDADGKVVGVLVGHTDFRSNPFVQPVIQALSSMKALGGEGIIINEKGVIIYAPSADQVMTAYLGTKPVKAAFFNEISPNNTRQYVYYQPASGRPWAVILTVPAQEAQQMSLDIAIPLLLILLAVSALALVFLWLGLRTISSSMGVLSQGASYIALGQLDHPLSLQGVDEIGRLSSAFEQMRASLKARLDELNRLLTVSQGVAANLDIREAVRPILEAAVSDGASAARLVLVHEVTLDAGEESLVTYGVGAMSAHYAWMDAQLFDLARQQDPIQWGSVARARHLQFPPGESAPAAVLGLAVRHENQYYGVIWLGYDRVRTFSDEEVRFLSTLAGQAALAATSARLYATAEVGRQRLEAVLACTPEPVLVVDEAQRLLLLNPAALQVPGLIQAAIQGTPIQEVVGSQEVIDLITMPFDARSPSREITLADGRVYYGSIAPVQLEGQPLGRVCVLRDITQFKELETMKSDFVATVSHDLRSPLTLMRGYATMLQMLGELNDQQKGYVTKIVSAVENMTRLVTHLLDLGRIEAGVGLQIERISVKKIITDVVDEVQPQALQKEIRLTAEPINAREPLLLQADNALIHQAIVNLVENAVKYTPAAGQVRIRVEARPGSLVFIIQDNGIGIAPLDQPHVFEKFYRSGRREAYQQRGTGLGLAIVKSIAERHGGRVWMESQLGKGSTFWMEIPCEQV